MGFIKWLLWTSFAIGFGVFLATYKVEGGTPYEHIQKVWKSKGPPLVEDAREAVTTIKPKETHSPEDRDQVNKLIAKRAAPK
jgi:hypothetical protein